METQSDTTNCKYQYLCQVAHAAFSSGNGRERQIHAGESAARTDEMPRRDCWRHYCYVDVEEIVVWLSFLFPFFGWRKKKKSKVINGTGKERVGVTYKTEESETDYCIGRSGNVYLPRCGEKQRFYETNYFPKYPAEIHFGYTTKEKGKTYGKKSTVLPVRKSDLLIDIFYQLICCWVVDRQIGLTRWSERPT